MSNEEKPQQEGIKIEISPEVAQEHTQTWP